LVVALSSIGVCAGLAACIEPDHYPGGGRDLGPGNPLTGAINDSGTEDTLAPDVRDASTDEASSAMDATGN
jgi:hypothetical protein